MVPIVLASQCDVCHVLLAISVQQQMHIPSLVIQVNMRLLKAQCAQTAQPGWNVHQQN